LSACSSSQASLEAQFKSDLQNVLESVTHNNPFQLEVEAPSVNGELSRAQLNMYMLVRAKAMQLALERNDLVHSMDVQNGSKENAGSHEANSKQTTADDYIVDRSGISAEERRVLKELNYSEDVYSRIKDTVDVTRAFLEAFDESKIMDLVTRYDPAIKHNLALVKTISHNLEIVNRYPIQRVHQGFNSSKT
jgi:hypothetical protein